MWSPVQHPQRRHSADVRGRAPGPAEKREQMASASSYSWHAASARACHAS